MKDSEIERLLEAQSKEDEQRHPFLHKAILSVSMMAGLGGIIGGAVYLTVRFPGMNSRDLFYTSAMWIIVLISTAASILTIVVGVKLTNWLDRRREITK